MPSELLILVPYNLSPKNIKRLKDASSAIEVVATGDPEKIRSTLPKATIFFGELKPEFMLLANKAKWVHSPYAGVENVLFPEFLGSDITLTCSKGIHVHQMTELLFDMMLKFTHRLSAYRRLQERREWNTAPYKETRLLAGSTIGILGLGKIGSEMAKAAKGFGMNVIGLRRNPSIPVEHVDLLVGREGLSRILRKSNHIVVILPLTAETRNLITVKEFDMMEQKPYVYNLARGPIVNTEDLIEALRTGKIKGAGLDVFDQEPLDGKSPLWGMENVIITPHIGGLVPHYFDGAIDLFIQNLRRFLRGEELLNVVDKQKGY
jgi:phosphoglycerate dehydrogenase-like enzyme